MPDAIPARPSSSTSPPPTPSATTRAAGIERRVVGGIRRSRNPPIFSWSERRITPAANPPYAAARGGETAAMIRRASIWGLFAILFASTRALSWEYQGHEMVGAIADRMLSANAQQQVQQILGFSLQVAAPWPDCVRSVVKKDDGTFDYLPSPFHPEYRIPCKSFERDTAPAEQARMLDYAARNWLNCTYIPGRPGQCHAAFHFADVTIQRNDYDRRYVGTSDHDVVSAINAAIFVLQGRPAPTPFS